MASFSMELNSSSSSSNLQELRDTVDRLASPPHVELVLVMNAKGDILQASSDDDTSNPKAAAAACQKLREAAQRALQVLNSDGDDSSAVVGFVQIRSVGGRELVLAPHGDYALAVFSSQHTRGALK